MSNTMLLKKAHHTLAREIEAVGALRGLLGKDLIQAVEVLASARGKVVVSGIGKSGQIGTKIASTFVSLGVPAVYLNPAEAMHGDLGVVGPGDVMIAISASGETKELLRLLKHVHRIKVPVVAITGAAKSSLAGLSAASLVFKIKEEGSPYNLAPMASSTASLVIGDILASALSAKKGFTDKDFAGFHPGGSLGLRLTKVSELSGRIDLPMVGKEKPLREAIRIMNRGSLGVVAIIDNGHKLKGVITDGDIRRALVNGEYDPAAPAHSIMTANPKTVGEADSLEDALIKMESHKITSLFTTDNKGRLCGILLMHDIIEHKML
jgi:arabinose-5-phosphate isomerase